MTHNHLWSFYYFTIPPHPSRKSPTGCFNPIRIRTNAVTWFGQRNFFLRIVPSWCSKWMLHHLLEVGFRKRKKWNTNDNPFSLLSFCSVHADSMSSGFWLSSLPLTRPYHVGNTGSRPITEIRRFQATTTTTTTINTKANLPYRWTGFILSFSW